jgi:rfaE bifunctional protein nucleotidyltransferase chain/domain
VRTLDELAEITARLKRSGKTVVHAHGTFDLLHVGHVRHLEAARKLGDVLVVTVTADRFVNKGPGRPVFTEGLRAEMLATLAYVDWVAINQAPDAVNVLKTVRPSIYVKGQDYVNPEGDVTGKIMFEREAVEAGGGRIHFTDEATFSSTELINRHFNVYEPHVRDHLNLLRADGGLTDILQLLERVRDYRVVLVGDAIIDEYQYVLPMGNPQGEHHRHRYQDKEVFAGGCLRPPITSPPIARRSRSSHASGGDSTRMSFERACAPTCGCTR